MLSIRRSIAAIAVLTACALMAPSAASAQAQADPPYWTCTSSAAYVDLFLGEPPFDPLHLSPIAANGASDYCADDDAGFPQITLGGGEGDPGQISVQAPFARTDIEPQLAPMNEQTISSSAGVAGNGVIPGAQIRSADGAFDLQVSAAGSEASAKCVNGVPTPTGTSTVATVLLNGEQIPTNINQEILVPLETQVLGNFNPIVEIHFNRQINEAGMLIVRAVDVTLKRPDTGEAILHAVVAESKVDWHGAVCAAPPSTGANCPAGTTQDPDDPRICIKVVPGACPQGTVANESGECIVAETGNCPAGSTKNDQGVCVSTNQPCPQGSTPNAQGQCVVPRGADGQCPPGSAPNAANECVVIERTCGPGTVENERGQCVIVASQCPDGSAKNAQGQCVAAGDGTQGTVPLQQIAGVRSASPCRNKKFGRQVGIVGTNRADRITGSNRSDRIFVFAANDRISGGRGNDCVEAGTGSDRFDGSNGTDYLLGASGNDIGNGGPGGDRLYGHTGNDKLIGASGNDRLYGGKGRDKLQGGLGTDRLYGGPGRDYIDSGGGRDRIYGGSGNDAINVANASAAVRLVDCGKGVDTVRINPNEGAVLRRCERVFVTRQVR